ncbi:MAG: type II toxin-antitoxin system PemK/MazF family toxin, partial [Candidatus Kapaibacteriota bacterium]
NYQDNIRPAIHIIGSEQGFTRPVLVISEERMNQLLPVVNVLPLTSRKPNRDVYPNEALLSAGTAGLWHESLVLCYQIRTLDKQRLTTHLGEISDFVLQESILEALRFQLAIS